MNAKRIWQLAALLLAAATVACAQTALAQEDPKARLAKAEAMFAERCKKAGVFIHRTAENVEGVFLMKVRPEGTNYGDQFKMDDPYGHDSTGDRYVRSFLVGRNKNGYLTSTPEAQVSRGYHYVEAADPRDGNWYRYTGRVDEPWRQDTRYSKTYTRYVLDKTPISGIAPRYGVTYDDISTREERDYWIAGSSLKVIDLKTNEVIAERIGYMIDRAQGERGGGRSPWLLAAGNACPRFPVNAGHTDQVGQARNFVERALKPSSEK
jgi:hypothetical protein